MFQGTSLRGMLLNAYGWWQMGQIALIAAIVSFVLAGSPCCCRASGSGTTAGCRWRRRSPSSPAPHPSTTSWPPAPRNSFSHRSLRRRVRGENPAIWPRHGSAISTNYFNA